MERFDPVDIHIVPKGKDAQKKIVEAEKSGFKLGAKVKIKNGGIEATVIGFNRRRYIPRGVERPITVRYMLNINGTQRAQEKDYAIDDLELMQNGN